MATAFVATGAVAVRQTLAQVSASLSLIAAEYAGT